MHTRQAAPPPLPNGHGNGAIAHPSPRAPSPYDADSHQDHMTLPRILQSNRSPATPPQVHAQSVRPERIDDITRALGTITAEIRRIGSVSADLVEEDLRRQKELETAVATIEQYRRECHTLLARNQELVKLLHDAYNSMSQVGHRIRDVISS